MMSLYGELGVDVKKRGVEKFKHLLSEAVYEDAFCPVFRAPWSRDVGFVAHADGAGSKPVQSYLHWAETGDVEWFSGLAQDVVAMNLDDLVCVAAEPVCLLDYVALNPYRLPKEEVLEALSRGFGECLGTLRELGVDVALAGGETADLPDQMTTLDVSGSVFGVVELRKVVTGRDVGPGDVIVGLRSGGRAKYERRENSGIMCNGITLARLSLMKPEYEEKYPEISASEGRYRGRYGIDDYVDELGMTVGEAILSPTRVYAPVVLRMLREFGPWIKGLVHDTGGGQTKCLRIGRGIHYVKDSLPEPDPIFRLIQREARVEWREMYEVFNMGIGFEVIVDGEYADDVMGVSEKFGVEAMVVGRCEKSPEKRNMVTVRSMYGVFRYP